MSELVDPEYLEQQKECSIIRAALYIEASQVADWIRQETKQELSMNDKFWDLEINRIYGELIGRRSLKIINTPEKEIEND